MVLILKLIFPFNFPTEMAQASRPVRDSQVEGRTVANQFLQYVRTLQAAVLIDYHKSAR